MKCAICGDTACDEIDPRMPLLRIPVCAHCRDLIAYTVGWCRSNGRRVQQRDDKRFRLWSRHGDVVEVPA